ncbi:LysR substrate-binding domain-containing protein [Planomonospora algeriensis]
MSAASTSAATRCMVFVQSRTSSAPPSCRVAAAPASSRPAASQSLIARGLGIGLLPRLALEAFTAPGVAVRPAAGLLPRTLHLVHPREADQIPAVRAAVRALRDTLCTGPASRGDAFTTACRTSSSSGLPAPRPALS